jgi:PAT family beta-lactamase induction signal transducer AmpG
MLVNLIFGLSSGLPLLMIGSTLQAWMTDQHVNLSVVGLFSLVGMPYTFKFAWAPFLDRYVPPFLGRRRGWIFITQLCLAASVAVLSFLSPAANPWRVALIAFLIAFFSASQDIVIDAYRREVLLDEELGLGSSMYVNGYRMGMLISGAFALILADRIPWHFVYLALAGTFVVVSFITIFAPEPLQAVVPPRSLKEAVVQPFLEYFRRDAAIEVLLFILLYKIGDSMAANLTTRFYLDLGFSKTDIGAVVKTFGLAATLTGGFIGGAAMIRLGLRKSLWFFGVFQALTILGFALLAQKGKSLPSLMGIVVADNLASAMGTSAFVAFMASLTNKRFTATQYALLTSLMGVPRVIVSAPTGFLAAAMGWTNFFIFCSLSAVPGLLLLLRFRKWHEPDAMAGMEPDNT